MRIPERCPWCGAGKSPKQRGLYECGADFCSHCGEWLVTCADSDTPAAKAYRETLAWRKRLSQHTGVPLRMVPEPIRIGNSPTWRGGIWFEPIGGRWRWLLKCWHRADMEQMRLTARERARRRLLAIGGDK